MQAADTTAPVWPLPMPTTLPKWYDCVATSDSAIVLHVPTSGLQGVVQIEPLQLQGGLDVVDAAAVPGSQTSGTSRMTLGTFFPPEVVEPIRQ